MISVGVRRHAYIILHNLRRSLLNDASWKPGGIMRSLLLGAAAGFSIALPLFGRIGNVPSSVIAAAVITLTGLVLLPSLFSTRRNGVNDYLPVFAAVALIACVLLSAHERQWVFLASPGLWKQSAERYFDAKLFLFLLNSGIGVAASIVVLAVRDRGRTIDGVCLGIIAVSLAAAMRLMISHGRQLWATDLDTARAFFAGDRSFSIVNYGVLMMLGAICSIRWRYGWITAALFLACAILLARRVDSALIVLSAVGLYGWAFLTKRSFSPLLRLAGFAVVAALIASSGINELSSVYFGRTFESLANRSTLLAASVGTAVDDLDYLGEAEPAQEFTGPRNIHEGLGHLSTGALGKFYYPHNLPVEIYREIGPVGLTAYAAIVLVPILMALIFLKTLKQEALVALCLLVAMFGITLKAGDITNAGKIMFFATIATIAIAPRRSKEASIDDQTGQSTVASY